MHARASSIARLISARLMSGSRLSRCSLEVFVSIGTGDVEPHVREHGILEDALAVGVHDSEVVLRSGDTLIGGQSVSAHRFGFILGDAFASGVHAPEVEPRTHKALVRSYAIQAHRLVFILEDAFTVAGPGCRSAAA